MKLFRKPIASIVEAPILYALFKYHATMDDILFAVLLIVLLGFTYMESGLKQIDNYEKEHRP